MTRDINWPNCKFPLIIVIIIILIMDMEIIHVTLLPLLFFHSSSTGWNGALNWRKFNFSFKIELDMENPMRCECEILTSMLLSLWKEKCWRGRQMREFQTYYKNESLLFICLLLWKLQAANPTIISLFKHEDFYLSLKIKFVG